MLKSTHRPTIPTSSPTLPPNWTEHKAPTGHSYYYNSVTKQSTYQRPEAEPESEILQIDYGATAPDPSLLAARSAFEEFNRHGAPDPNKPDPSQEKWSNGVFKYDRIGKLNQQGDKVKSKMSVPGCEGWMLVRTAYGRRFVHNIQTGESLWKFPSEVISGVIELDRIEWEKEQRIKAIDEKKREVVEEQRAAEEEVTRGVSGDQVEIGASGHIPEDYDSDEYEEVEVTDDEDGGLEPKRPRIEEYEMPDRPSGPQAMDEDDIAYQLAQLEEEEARLEQDDYNFSDHDDTHVETGVQGEEEEEGLPMTDEDNIALFRALLDGNRVSPFSPFEILTEGNTDSSRSVLSDDRWLVMPNMAARRAAFASWSRDRIAEQKTISSTDDTTQSDPRATYLQFLMANASTKLYWPEFKRKHRKEPAMTDRNFTDRDREKLYREYILKLTKLSSSEQRKEMLAAMKTESWLDKKVPGNVQKDLRFYVVRSEDSRQEIINGFVMVLSE